MELVTKRCLVRPFRAEDVDAFMAYRNDLGWMRYQSFKGLSRAEYEQSLFSGTLDTGLQLAITCRETGALFGDLYLKREGEHCWLGYTIAPLRARQGYTYEAASAAIVALPALGVKYAMAGIEVGNKASSALLKKLGFVLWSAKGNEQIYFASLQ